jgi:hypothetical protein
MKPPFHTNKTPVPSSTVHAPSYFRSVQDTLPQARYSGNGSAAAVGKRDLVFDTDHAGVVAMPAFPAQVNCHAWSPPRRCRTSTITVTAVSTVTPAIVFPTACLINIRRLLGLD